MADIVLGRLQSLQMLESIFQTLELYKRILVFRRRTTRLFQRLANLSNQICKQVSMNQMYSHQAMFTH